MSALYDKARQAFADKLIDWLNDDIIALLINTTDPVNGYNVNLHTHQYLSSVPAASRVAGGTFGSRVTLTNKTDPAGICDADDILFESVTGLQLDAVILAQRSNSDFESSRLLVFIDSVIGFPIVPNGGNVEINWSTGLYKIFEL